MVRMQDVLPSPLSPQKDTILGVVLLGLFTMSWISLNALSYYYDFCKLFKIK